ncbi:MAG: caspase family protein [Hyphomonadaceae bacterium]|nr:caspase family protein [Hyphomonadaceae bacterium]
MKKALVIGIDDYNDAPLQACVNDAIAVGGLLETNGDGSPNFDVRLLTSNNLTITSEVLLDAIQELFQGDAEVVLLYFAGHGIINAETNAGYLVSQDGRRGSWGASFSDILTLANGAYPRVKSTVIVIDNCQSGAFGELPPIGATLVSAIGTGVTILTACNRDQSSVEFDGHGLFTSILIDSLRGSSADISGRITPASVYAHVDQTLGSWEQRPIYKANVHSFVKLREVPPKIAFETLRRLHVIFPEPTSIVKLDPSFEPDRGEETARLSSIAVDEDNVRLYRELQSCNRHGLVVPVDQPHMWHAAVYATGCRLTAVGAHYRKLAEMKRI